MFAGLSWLLSSLRISFPPSDPSNPSNWTSANPSQCSIMPYRTSGTAALGSQAGHTFACPSSRISLWRTCFCSSAPSPSIQACLIMSSWWLNTYNLDSEWKFGDPVSPWINSTMRSLAKFLAKFVTLGQNPQYFLLDINIVLADHTQIGVFPDALTKNVRVGLGC